MKRKLAILLSIVLTLGAAPIPAFGAEGCTHHTVHTADCGYSEGTEGTPCTHEHDDSCYAETLICTSEEEGHEHTADCYEATLACVHEHDADCGYSEGEEGSPCAYVCGICNVQALIDALPDADEITEDMAEEVGEQLMEIDAEKAQLSDDEAAEVDITRYRAAEAALMELNEDTWIVDEPTEMPAEEQQAAEPMPAAETGDECTYTIAGGTEKTGTFADAVAACQNAQGGTITLSQDVALNNEVKIEEGDITINGGGYTITGGGKYSAFNVKGNANVTFENVTLDGGAVWSNDDPETRTNSGKNNSGSRIYLFSEYAHVVLGNGTILQNNDARSAGDSCVYVRQGTLEMRDGVKICNNTCSSGGAVKIENGSFIMKGGEISGNYSSGGDGGGAIYINGSGSFTMEGGTISDNVSMRYGGAVYMSSGKFTMSGGTISGNLARGYGGAAYVSRDGTLDISGGQITGNTAGQKWSNSFGGGVYFNGAEMTVHGTPVITGNTVINWDGEGKTTNNVYLLDGKVIKVGDDGLKSGADIGVTTQKNSADTQIVEGTANCADCFHDDRGNYQIKWENGQLVLADKPLPVAINGEDFTKSKLEIQLDGGGTAKLDVGKTPYTLTLTDATIESTGYNTHGIQTSIFEGTDLIIKLEGKNKITTTGNNKGIYVPNADLTIIGDGSLEIDCEEDYGISATSTKSYATGQRNGGNITISDGAQLKLSGKSSLITAGEELKISDSTIEGNIVAEGYPYQAVLGGNYGVTINDSKITASAEANLTEGIYSTNGNVTIEGSEVTIKNVTYNGIEAKGISIGDSNVDVVTSGDIGMAMYSTGSDITITNSTVYAECASDWHGIFSSGNMTMTGGKVTAKCEKDTNETTYGINARGTVTVDGTELLAIGSDVALKGANVEFNGATVFVSENIDGTNQKVYQEGTDTINTYKWVKTTMAKPFETPEIKIDFKNELLTGFEQGTYTINGDDVSPVNGSLSVEEYIGTTISIVRKGNDGVTTFDSPAQDINVPARPDAPTGVTGGKEKISGVNSDMEYSKKGTDTWTPVPAGKDSVAGLSKGEYEVRVQAGADFFASQPAIVTVTKKKSSSSGGGSSTADEPTYPPTVEENEGGTADVSTKKPEKGEEVTVTPKAEEGYVPEKVIVRDENGDKVKVTEEKDGTYTFIQPEGAVTIEVVYKEETEEEQPEKQPGQPTEQPVFSDVTEKDWFYEAVQAVAEKGIMGKAGVDAFLPAQNTTRGMIAEILYRMSEESYPDVAVIFPDVKEGTYYHNAVAWGTDHSVLKGYDDGLFRPDRPITREELALLIYNFAKYCGLDVSNIEGMGIYEFTDYAEISDWSMTAVRYCLNAGLLNGRDDGSFDPRGLATRAEVASVLQRFLEQ